MPLTSRALSRPIGVRSAADHTRAVAARVRAVQPQSGSLSRFAASGQRSARPNDRSGRLLVAGHRSVAGRGKTRHVLSTCWPNALFTFGGRFQAIKTNAISAIDHVLALPTAALVLRIGGHHVVNTSLVFPLLREEEFSAPELEFDRLADRTRAQFGEEALVVAVTDAGARVTGSPAVAEAVESALRGQSQEQPHAELNPRNAEVAALLAQVDAVERVLASLVESRERRPIRSVFWFQIDGLARIQAGSEDAAVKRAAERLVADTVHKVSDC